jgi:hypothetical protein
MQAPIGGIMEGMKNLMKAVLVLLGVVLTATLAQAAYVWTDDKGRIRFADTYEQIPEKYRDNAVGSPTPEWKSIPKGERKEIPEPKPMTKQEQEEYRVRQEKERVERQEYKEKVERLAAGRKAFAKGFETLMLDKGQDYLVWTSGPEDTTLTIKWVLINRPFVHNFMKGDALPQLRNLGFKVLIFTDGMDFTVGYELH